MSVEDMGHTRVNIYAVDDSSSVWLQLFEELTWDDTNPFLIVLLGVIIVRFFIFFFNNKYLLWSLRHPLHRVISKYWLLQTEN